MNPDSSPKPALRVLTSEESSARARTPLRERLKQATEEAILEAAEEVFSLHGLQGAKMEEIASAAGVAVGTLYNHFEDRDALMSHLLKVRASALEAALDQTLHACAKETFEKQLRSYLQTLCTYFEDHLPFLAILMEGEHSAVLRKLGKKPHSAMAGVRERTLELVQRGLKQKALRTNDADFFPTMLMGIVKGSVTRRLTCTREDLVPLTDQVERMVRFFLQGARA